MSTIYQVLRNTPEDGEITIIRYIGDKVEDEIYVGRGPTLTDALRDARSLVRTDLNHQEH